MKRSVRVVMTALFTALIAVGAFIQIPTPMVPLTLQMLFVLLSGVLLGPVGSAVSATLYVVLGLCGVPIFAAGGGIAYVLKPSFGYLIGFIVGGALIGWLSRRTRTFRGLLAACLLGTLVIYVLGTWYCFAIRHWYLGQTVEVWPLLVACVWLPLPGDLVGCVAAAFLGYRLRKAGFPERVEKTSSKTSNR